MKNKISSFFLNKSVLFGWLFSYFIILLAPMISSIIIYIASEKIVRNQIYMSNNAMLKQVQQTLDSRLSDAKKLGLQIASHQNVNSLRIDKEPIDYMNWYSFSRITKDLLPYTATNTFIGLHIYIHNTNVILNPGGSTYSELLYKSKFEGTGLTYEYWNKLLNEQHTDAFMSLPMITEHGTKSNSITYLTSLPLKGFGTPYATLMILMDQQKFFETLENMNLENQGTVFIINEQDHIISSRQTEEIQNMGLKYENLLQYNAISHFHMNDSLMAASYIPSRETNWKYVNIVPDKILSKKVEQIKKISLVSMLITMLVGFVLSYLLAKKNYNPLQSLVKSLTNNTDISVQSHNNEYSFINNAISNTLQEKDMIHKKLEQQNLSLRQNFLTRLIKGKLNNVQFEESLSEYKIELFSDSFAVMLFYLEDIKQAFDGKIKVTNENELELIYFVFENVVEELAGKHHKGYVFEVDGMLVCLINFKNFNYDSWNDELLRIANEAKEFIEKTFYVYFTVSISDIQHSVESIVYAYQHAIEAMEYRLLNQQGEIISYKQTITDNSFEYELYSLEMEYQLINCIRVGDLEKAKYILNQVFENVFKKSIPIYVAKCLMFDIVSTMIKIVSELSDASNTEFIEALDPVGNLLACASFIEMHNKINDILKHICDYIEENKMSHNENLRDRIIEYVQQNYADINLSISAIGNYFSKNAVYLSRFFKEQTGETLLEFINKTRVKKAKELLKTENLNITETAVKSGFYNSNALIRAFKKYEGVTPGRYKENLQDKN